MSFKIQTDIARKVIDLKVDEQSSNTDKSLEINKLLSIECMLSKEYKTQSFFGHGLARMYDLYFFVNLFFTGLLIVMIGLTGALNGINSAFIDTFVVFLVIFTLSIIFAFFAKRKNKLSYIMVLVSSVISFNIVLIILALLTVFKLKNHPFMYLSQSEKEDVKKAVDKIRSGAITNIEQLEKSIQKVAL